MKRIISSLLLAALLFACTGCGKSETLKAAETAVKAIGNVTLESGEAITQAETAINALTEEDKKEFKLQETMDEKKAEYKQLQSQKKIDDVITKIDAITEVSIEAGDIISVAKKQYDALSTAEKASVTNAEKLLSAHEELKKLKSAQAEALLSTMKLEEDRVRGLKFYYPNGWKFYANGNWAADVRCFMLPYIGRDTNSSWLRLIYNYTGDDWVFFKSLILAVDGKQYHESFNYFDIVRDNEAGDVWEYIDIEVADSELDRLWEIANSQETIIRFQGDDYSHDYTVTATDKQALKDALTAYEALN